MCQEVECIKQAKGTALKSRNPWVGLFSEPGFIFLPALCDKADLSTLRWLLTHVRRRERILLWPQTSPATVILLHPQAELLRFITHFTNSCKASGQGQAWSSISCLVWQEPAARDLLQPHAFYPIAMPSPHQTWRPVGSRYLHREVISVLCCGWHLPWVAFLYGGSPFIFRIQHTLDDKAEPLPPTTPPLLKLIKPPGSFHFTFLSFGTSVWVETSLSFLPQGQDIESGGTDRYQLVAGAHAHVLLFSEE